MQGPARAGEPIARARRPVRALPRPPVYVDLNLGQRPMQPCDGLVAHAAAADHQLTERLHRGHAVQPRTGYLRTVNLQGLEVSGRWGSEAGFLLPPNQRIREIPKPSKSTDEPDAWIVAITHLRRAPAAFEGNTSRDHHPRPERAASVSSGSSVSGCRAASAVMVKGFASRRSVRIRLDESVNCSDCCHSDPSYPLRVPSSTAPFWSIF